MKYKLVGGFLIVLGVVIVVSVLYHNSLKRQQSIIFTPNFMLDALWQTYKHDYWDANSGRTVDKQRDNVTTSEGQSYTMLRAVWEDDQATFGKTWDWTEHSLKHANDNLFSWAYGPLPDGSYGILTAQGGQNAASDADGDIALALLFAGSRWHNTAYTSNAKGIIADMWDKEVIVITGKPYMSADDVEKTSADPTALINPSYLSPYSYRIFALADTQHDWQGVVDTSYEVIGGSMAAAIGTGTPSQLPPDWIAINKKDGTLAAPRSSALPTNFGFDALRVPWRLALDYQWYKDPRDAQLLQRMSFLGITWQSSHMLASTYSHAGAVIISTETPAMYGGALGYFITDNPQQANEIYTQKLATLYNSDTQTWKTPLSYYDSNWAWFGLALYNGKLVNLYAPAEQTSGR